MNLSKKTKKLIIAIFFGIAILCAVLFFVFQGVNNVKAAWWNDSWGYRKSVQINNSSGVELVDYQVEVLRDVNLSGLVSDGKLDATLKDLRFTDSFGRVLDYWIKDSTNSSVNVWVKISSIPASGATVYMYYGNQDAQDAQNGKNTFQFFDDFSSDTLNEYFKYGDTGPWSVGSGNLVASDTDGDAYSYLINQSVNYSNTESFAIESSVKMTGTAAWGGFVIFGTESGLHHIDFNKQRYDDRSTVFEKSGSTGLVNETWYEVSLRYDGSSGTLKWYRNGSLVYTDATVGSEGNSSGGVGFTSNYYNNTYLWDYICVRKHTPNEPSVGSFSSEQTAPGPLGFWKFDEGYGSLAYDSSGRKNHGTITGATWVQNGVTGRALSFDGVDDNINMGDPQELGFTGAFSISAWVKIDNMPSVAEDHQGIVTKWDHTNNKASYYLSLRNDDSDDFGNFRALLYNDTINQYLEVKGSNDSAIEGSWYNVVITYNGGISGDAGDLNLYVNGVLTDSNSQNASFTGLEDVDADFVIGGWDPDHSGGKIFNGIIDEVRVYDTELSHGQIKQLYNMNSGSFSVGASSLPKSCMDQLSRNPNSSDGVYLIDPGPGVDPFEVYCDMTTRGGGWTLVWKNFGGPLYSNYSGQLTNSALWASSTNTLVKPFSAQGGAIGSHKNVPAWNAFIGKENVEWIKMGRAYNSSGSSYPFNYSHASAPNGSYYTHPYDVVLDMGASVTLSDVMTTSTCVVLDNQVEMFIDGVSYGKTDRTNEYNGTTSIGFANNEATTDDCGQSADNLMNGWGARHVISYNHTTAGRDTVRCQFECWGTTNVVEEVIWGVREKSLVSQEGIVLNMPFESNESNTTYDISGNQNNGAISGASHKGAVNCKFGKCFDFDGTDDYITVTNNGQFNFGTNSDFSISAWFKTTSSPQYTAIVSKKWSWIASGAGYGISMESGQVKAVISDGTNLVTSSSGTTYSDGNWHFVVATWDRDGYQKLYVDGVLKDSDSITAVGDVSTETVYIGRWRIPDWAGYSFFDGMIDEVKVYRAALTQREIMMEMNAGKNIPVLEIGFDEGSGNSVYDKSFSKNNGTITGALWKRPEDCVSGSCLWFDGSADNVAISSSVPLKEKFTISHWVRTTSSGGQMYTVGNAGSADGYRFGLTSGKVSFLFGSGSYTESMCGSKTVNDGKWHMITGVFESGSSFKCYIDGKYESFVSVGSYPSMQNSAPGIGAPPCCTNYSGYLDELKIYSYNLTAQEIRDLYIQSSGQIGQTKSVGSKIEPASSCADVMARNQKAADGKYWIDPTRGSTSDAIEVYCDMSRGGGGWTLVARVYDSDDEFLYDDTEWKTSGTEFGSIDKNGYDYRSLAFGNLNKTQLMICDDGKYGCNIDTNFSSLETLSQTFASAPEGVGLATARSMETYVWGTNYCQDFWNSSSYRINWFDSDGSPKARISGTLQTDWMGGIGHSTENMSKYDVNCSGDSTPDLPPYVEIYVKETTISPASLNPVLDMDFEQYSGGLYLDKSGNSNNATPYNSPDWKKTINCKVGKCLFFDGIDDYISSVDTSSLDLTNAITVSAWIYPTDTDDLVIAAKRDDSNYAWEFSVSTDASGNKLIGRINSNSYQSLSSASIQENTWTHVAMTYDKDAGGTDEIKTYINGSLDGTYDYSSSISTNDVAVSIGRRLHTVPSYFHGFIDEVKIYNRALTQYEISKLHNNGAPIGLWRFDEAKDNSCSDGNDACDSSGNSNNGIFYGEPSWITEKSSCKQGGCLSFDGTDDYVAVPEEDVFDLSTNFSLSAWVYPTSSGDSGYKGIISKKYLTESAYSISYDGNNKLAFRGSDGVSYVTHVSSSSLLLNHWSHVLVSYNGFKMNLYINGALDSSFNETASMRTDRSEGLDIGRRAASGRYFPGRIDDVRIYNYALSQEDVAQVYNGGLIKFK